MNQANPNRAKLKELSAPFRNAVKIGSLPTVNEGLRRMYAEQGHTELKTLRQWNKDGKRVKKGETALLMWARPTRIQKPATSENTAKSEEDEMDFFPICYLFSQNQVQ